MKRKEYYVFTIHTFTFTYPNEITLRNLSFQFLKSIDMKRKEKKKITRKTRKIFQNNTFYETK